MNHIKSEQTEIRKKLLGLIRSGSLSLSDPSFSCLYFGSLWRNIYDDRMIRRCHFPSRQIACLYRSVLKRQLQKEGGPAPWDSMAESSSAHFDDRKDDGEWVLKPNSLCLITGPAWTQRRTAVVRYFPIDEIAHPPDKHFRTIESLSRWKSYCFICEASSYLLLISAM